MMLPACISIDVDTLASIYKGRGCTRQGGYTYLDLRQGLENIHIFFERYQILTTLFMVGTDFQPAFNHHSIKAIHQAGHEIANHSMTHPQGFRWLSSQEKENEIRQMGKICKNITDKTPIGFRSPGWNIDNETIPVLLKLGYQYDSSIFPTFLMPIMKLAHWASTSAQPDADRTTMGMWRYMFAPLQPYHTDRFAFEKRGEGGLIEFPLTVTPILRIPFFATMLLFTGNTFFKRVYRTIRNRKMSIHFQMHLSDFVDYNQREFENQVPNQHAGVYLPQAINMPLEKKMDIFKKVIDEIRPDYQFLTLQEWLNQMGKEG